VAAGRTARAAWAAKETGPDRDGLERGVTLGRARAGRARWLTKRDVLSAAQSERAALPAEGDAGRWGRRAGARAVRAEGAEERRPARAGVSWAAGVGQLERRGAGPRREIAGWAGLGWFAGLVLG